MYQLSEESKKIAKNSSYTKSILIKVLDSDFPDITIDYINGENMTLTDALCENANQLEFGECNSAELSIELINYPYEIQGYELEVHLQINSQGIDIPLGIFYVKEINKSTDDIKKTIKCYDRMVYLQEDVVEWYNSMYPSVDSVHTIKELRSSLLQYLDIEEETITLVNDDITVLRTIDTPEIMAIDIMRCVCQINGVFGHIDREGRFVYKSLETNAIYPSETLYPNEELYPGGDSELEYIDSSIIFSGSTQSEYIVATVNRLNVATDDSDIGCIITSPYYTPETSNTYYVNSNFLIYGKDAEQLETITRNLSTKIFGVNYRPNITNVVGIPYMDVGDYYYIDSVKFPFNSFLMKRTLKGIVGMRDTFESSGDEYRPNVSNTTNKQLVQIQSRVNKISHTVDENKLEISRVETNLKDNYSTTTEMNSAITQSAESIKTEVSKTLEDYSTTTEMNSAIKVSFDNITQTVSETYQVKGDYATNTSVSTQINQTARSISLSAFGGENSVGITIKLLDANGNEIDTQTATANIEITGVVKFSDLSNSGSTVINGDNITTGTINANKVTISNLVVGENVSMGENATISWSNVTNHPNFITGEMATQITKDTVTTSYVNALNIKAGSVDAENISGTTITGKQLRQFWGQNNFEFSVNSGHIEWNMNGVRNWISPEGINLETLGQVLHLNQCDDFKLAQFMVANGGKVYANGYYNATGNYPTLSDKRIKNDLGYLDIEKTAKFVYSLKPTKFTYKKDKSKAIHHGLYAQDVEQSMDGEKWALFEDNSCDLKAPKDFRYKMIDYTELIADLIATVQSQNKRIDRLEILKG